MAGLFRPEEKAIFALRKLYHRYGYTPFKMSKFESYDLYMQNKDFLVSDGIITFTDTDGTLMALKPDVTLSIVKNYRSSVPLQKVHYSENVYRIPGAGRTYQEIMQTGLECLGQVGLYEICEVIMLAAKSLQAISPAFVLDLSHMQIVSDLMGELSLSEESKALALRAIAEKNEDVLLSVCSDLSSEERDLLISLLHLSGSIGSVLPSLAPLCRSDASQETLKLLETVYKLLQQNDLDKHVQLDFSMVNDMNYYNGIVFRGYVEGIPVGILSGGQYDKLMKKMGKDASGIGFAVYLDQLQRLDLRQKEFDIDTVIIYSQQDDILQLSRLADEVSADGSSVLLLRELPENLRCRTVLHFEEGGLKP